MTCFASCVVWITFSSLRSFHMVWAIITVNKVDLNYHQSTPHFKMLRLLTNFLRLPFPIERCHILLRNFEWHAPCFIYFFPYLHPILLNRLNHQPIWAFIAYIPIHTRSMMVTQYSFIEIGRTLNDAAEPCCDSSIFPTKLVTGPYKQLNNHYKNQRRK